MYIWILLAAVMIALSFFNLSPRYDKDNVFSEIKAESIVNRFKAKHNAAVRTMECEVALGLNNQSWRQETDFSAISMTSNILNNLGYTDMEANLPIGFVDNNLLNVKHAIYCLNNRMDKAGNAFKECRYSEYIYMVSYAAIPDNWLRRNTGSNQKMPLPAFENLLAKGTSSKNPYGWTLCTGAGEGLTCSMKGLGARMNLKNEETGKMELVVLSGDSIAWKNPEFAAICSNQPCLFSYQKMQRADVKGHCKKMVDDYNKAQNNS